MTGLLDRRSAGMLLCLLAAVPLLLPAMPPLTDLGGHIGRYAIQLDGSASPELRRWYTFEWQLLPNLGVDFLVQAIGPVIGLELAVKLIVAAIPALQAAGLLLVARAAHGRIPVTAWFAVPLVYGHPLHYGFVNFALGVALALLAFALWIELGARGMTRRRWLIFAPIGVVLWICHIMGLAVFCILAGADVLLREWGRRRSWLSALALTALAMLPLAAGPALGLLFGDGAAPATLFEYRHASRKLLWLAETLRDRWQLWDIASSLFLIAVAAGLWRSDKFELDRGLAAGALLLLLAFALSPEIIMGSAYADMRLTPVVLMLFLIAVRPSPGCDPRLAARVAVVALLFCGARLVGNAVSLLMFDSQARQSLAVLDAVPRHANLVTIPVSRCRDADNGWTMERRKHLSGYAVARRHAFDNGQWNMPGGQVLQVHNPSARPFERDPLPVVFDIDCEGAAGIASAAKLLSPQVEVLWLIGAPGAVDLPGWHVAASAGDSIVYRRMSSPLPTPPKTD